MNDAAVSVTGKLLWSPDLSAQTAGQVPSFAGFVNERAGTDWGGDFQALWQWSVDQNVEFWDLFWD